MQSKYLLILLLFIVAACQTEESKNIATDKKEDLRVISTAPSLTEILYFLDSFDNVVGVTNYCKFPAAAKDKPKIGALFNPNFEQIIALRPNLLVLLPSSVEQLQKLEQFGIKLLIVRNETIEDILESVRLIGAALGKEKNAAKLIVDMTSLIAKKEEVDPISVMIIVNRHPGVLKDIYVSGKDTYLSQLIELSGFKNVYSNLATPYAQVGIESIMEKSPAVILETQMTDIDSTYWEKDLSDWTALPGIAAVKSENIYVVSSSYTHLPATRVFKLNNMFTEIRKEANND